MLEVAIIALALGMVASLGVIIYLAMKSESRSDEVHEAGDTVARTREALDAALLDAERARFELMTTSGALSSEKARAKALEEYVASQAQSTDPSVDLAPDDVAGRLLRMSQRWAAAGVPAAAGQVPAVAAASVPPSTGAVAPDAPPVPKP